jgi:hypothetical protein
MRCAALWPLSLSPQRLEVDGTNFNVTFDGSGHWLDGSKSYRLTLKAADTPTTHTFWSARCVPLRLDPSCLICIEPCFASPSSLVQETCQSPETAAALLFCAVSCETEGPIDQKRLGQSKACFSVELSKPPSAPGVTEGKNAPYPMPMVAYASASVRSAAAMSGRLSRSCDGTPTGIVGAARSRGLTGMLKSGAALPIRVAIACSYCARVTPTLI